ncbi:stage III sporulation protein SpoIIIAB [Clostridium sp. MT-14]|jgi:stage III sporulation protein AB|uniref:Stage III sporulation protein SpoAB n=1 Tax=Clostridium aromativorans TaxID=2836848 RepID=A0ABS8N5M0_9CLOT|nr:MULTISPECIES: stage III sporulation protein SpoIIIAB [Clostridium]KAA8674888.1 stage III sporulation protein SpoAB [Clostridium sp. HV4-5-A1G]MCC9294048.1 stage III sporulation protein SpoAB [Clostridium aromativorans]CAB1242936.1 Stage III sporulation protein AB [Clostridiaceae bacterium BL-3]
MLKILGYIMIIFASTGIGFTYGGIFKKRVEQLKEMQRCIHQLQNEIMYTHTPLPDAILNTALKSIDPIKDVFKDISSMLYSNSVDNVYEAFKCAFSDKREILSLKNEDISAILDLSKTLGESDIEGQKRMFSLTLDNIKNQIEVSKIAMNKNLKMYRCLGFSLGAVIVIISV